MEYKARVLSVRGNEEVCVDDERVEEAQRLVESLRECVAGDSREALMESVDRLIDSEVMGLPCIGVFLNVDLVKALLGVVRECGDFEMAIHILTLIQTLIQSNRGLFRSEILNLRILDLLKELWEKDSEFTEISLNLCALMLTEDDLSKDIAKTCYKMALLNLEEMEKIDATPVQCSFYFFTEALKVRALEDRKVSRLVSVIKRKLLERMPHPYFDMIVLCLYSLIDSYGPIHSMAIAQTEFKFIWMQYLAYDWNISEVTETHPLILVISMYQCIFFYNGGHLSYDWNPELQKLVELFQVHHVLLRERALKALAMAVENIPDPEPVYQNLDIFLSEFNSDKAYDFKTSLVNMIISLLALPNIGCEEICHVLTSEAFQFLIDNQDDLNSGVQQSLKLNVTKAAQKFLAAGQLEHFAEVLNLPDTPIESVLDGSWASPSSEGAESHSFQEDQAPFHAVLQLSTETATPFRPGFIP